MLTWTVIVVGILVICGLVGWIAQVAMRDERDQASDDRR